MNVYVAPRCLTILYKHRAEPKSDAFASRMVLVLTIGVVRCYSDSARLFINHGYELAHRPFLGQSRGIVTLLSYLYKYQSGHDVFVVSGAPKRLPVLGCSRTLRTLLRTHEYISISQGQNCSHASSSCPLIASMHLVPMVSYRALSNIRAQSRPSGGPDISQALLTTLSSSNSMSTIPLLVTALTVIPLKSMGILLFSSSVHIVMSLIP